MHYCAFVRQAVMINYILENYDTANSVSTEILTRRSAIQFHLTSRLVVLFGNYVCDTGLTNKYLLTIIFAGEPHPHARARRSRDNASLASAFCDEQY